MRSHSRANRIAFRRAVWASVVLHALAAITLVVFVRTDANRPVAPRIDTRASDEPQVRMSLTEVATSVEVAPLEPVAPPAAEATATQNPPTPTPEPQGPPLATSRPSPQTLPPELVALIRKPAPVAAPAATNPPVADPNVRPAAGASAPEATGPASTPAIHGPLAPNQTVVYVLDCSGSMGAAGKLDAARSALVATLKQQPATVRFQVITYAGGAIPLLTTNGTALPATEANIRNATDRLVALEARGKSNHATAIRAALAFRPDVVLLLTDADDLDPATLKSLLASSPKPVLGCVGQVTVAGVQRPRELK